MRTIIKSLVAGAVALGAAACSGTQASQTELSADLRKDLELAKASGLELASSQQTPDPVVSAIEIAPAGQSTESDVAPRPRPRRQAPPAPTPAAPAPSPEVAEAPMASEVAETEAVAEAAPLAAAPAPADDPVAPQPVYADEPQVVTGPQALPDDGDAPVRRPRGGWGGLGGLGGVIIRGGMGGVDDCAIHPRPGVGRRYPGGMVIPGGPVYRTPTSGGRDRVTTGPRTRGGASGGNSVGLGGARTRGGVRM